MFLSDVEKDFVEMKKKASPPMSGGAVDVTAANAMPIAAGAHAGAQAPAVVPPATGFGKDTWQAIRKVTAFAELQQRDMAGEIGIIIQLVDANL